MTKITEEIIHSETLKCIAYISNIINCISDEGNADTNKITDDTNNKVVLAKTYIDDIENSFEKIKPKLKELAEELIKEAESKQCNIVFLKMPPNIPFPSLTVSDKNIYLTGTFGTIFPKADLYFSISCAYLLIPIIPSILENKND